MEGGFLNVGIGLPNAVPGVRAGLLVEWAQKADEGPFSSVGVVDRIVYECHDPTTTLAAVAAATERVGLVTMVVIGPLRNNAALAKEAATIDAVSGGRLTLGLALGARSDDYAALGVATRGRGDRLTEQLLDLGLFWERDEVAPLTKGPRLLVGGSNDVSFLRMARYADGYVHGGGPPRTFVQAADGARTAWSELERAGSPQLWAQGYFALGDRATVERGRAYMRDYYAFTGPFAERIAEGMLATPQAVAQFVRGYAEAGCDELVLFPAVADLGQIELLAAALAEV
ncbi:MAG: LLM class flavin-dependent oxidoreductase [Actinomycetota bacterium]|nr:LLM class flavin-dependent oxidoreductase [Actinomycetota bacterium]